MNMEIFLHEFSISKFITTMWFCRLSPARWSFNLDSDKYLYVFFILDGYLFTSNQTNLC